MDNVAPPSSATDLDILIATRNNQIRELAAKNSHWELYSSELKQELDKSTAENSKMRNQIAQLQQLYDVSQFRLAESERARLSLEEDMEKSKKVFGAEISFLKTQAEVFAEDFNGIKRELDATKTELSAVKLELQVVQNASSIRAQSANQMSMDDIRRRREESLARYRRQYELQNPGYQAQQRGVYQTDSIRNNYSDGEDEIDGCMN